MIGSYARCGVGGGLRGLRLSCLGSVRRAGSSSGGPSPPGPPFAGPSSLGPLAPGPNDHRYPPLNADSEHVDTSYNLASHTFNFSPENWQAAREIIARYPSGYMQSATAPLLDLAQRQCGGWLPLAAMNKVAAILEITPMQVYEVASFYTMFNRTPVGRFLVQICGTTPCHTSGAVEVMRAVERRLGIKSGQTTRDGAFTLLEVECLGACANAPMMQVNDEYYEDLTPESAIDVLDRLVAGKPVEDGVQGQHRKWSAQRKRTCLFNTAGANQDSHASTM